MIIGSIWVAAAQVSHRQKISDTIAGIFSISQNLRRAITIHDSALIGWAGGLNPFAIASRFIPAGWTSKDNEIRHPFGGKAHLVNYTSPERFDFGLVGLSRKDCNSLAAEINGKARHDRDFYTALRIFADGTMTLNTSLPTNLTGLECSGTDNWIYLNFKFTIP